MPPEGGWPAFHALLDRHEASKGVAYSVPNVAGATIWREIDGRPRFDGDGAFLGYEGVGRDVTEQRRITADLRESLALVDTVLEVIPIPVVQKGRAVALPARQQGLRCAVRRRCRQLARQDGA